MLQKFDVEAPQT